MLDIVRIGSLGIFRTEDFLRAMPKQSTHYEARLGFMPKLPMESFQFVLIEKTEIEIALYFKRMEPKETDIDPDYLEVIDPSNARATDRRITLDEDAAIALLGWDAATYPPRDPVKEPQGKVKLSKERADAVNFRGWIGKVKKINKAQSEADEAMATLPATDHPDYQDLVRKAFAKAPTDEEKNELIGLKLKIETAFQARVTEWLADPDFVASLTPRWTENKDVNQISLTEELLDECLDRVFGKAVVPAV